MVYYFDSNYSQNDQYFESIQPFFAESSYDYSNHRFLESDQTPYYDSYVQYQIQSTMAYSSLISSVPLFIKYNQTAPTKFTVSYASMEFNEPDFQEYDPTPYGGGYDPTLVYGKPLPPSDEICYPHSSFNSNSLSSDDSVKEKIKEDAVKPHIDSKPTSGHEDHKTDDCKDLGEPLESDHYYEPVSFGSIEEPVNQYEKIVPLVPSGYGLEAMDICESVFGYWPCLSRMNKNGNGGNEPACEDTNVSLGLGAADYLFGSSNPYAERRAEIAGYGESIYGYERHYHEQPLYKQREFDQDSWLPMQGNSALYSDW